MLFNRYCKKHPKYTGIREPKGGIEGGCMACVRLFLDKRNYRNSVVEINFFDKSRLCVKTYKGVVKC
jgi:hypothetical protein